MLTGQNGILNRAAEAKEKIEKSQEEENKTLNDYEETINKYVSNLPSTEYTQPYLLDAKKFERVDGTNLNSGLVIREKETGSEYVWIEVPRKKEIYSKSGINVVNFTDDEYKSIENDLKDYVVAYRSDNGYIDEFHEDDTKGWFFDANEYNNAKRKMLKSIYQNGGFWVGRYEAGSESNKLNTENDMEIPLSKESLYPYIYVTRTQAKILAEKVESGSYTSSLMFGIQWDLILKYIETKNEDKENINYILKNDSTSIGNYLNSEIELNQGMFSRYNENNWYNFDNSEKIELVKNKKKIAQESYENGILLTTGASKMTCLQNMYDLAGNVWEWTLEYTTVPGVQCAHAGGGYTFSGKTTPVRGRSGSDSSYKSAVVGFRVSIY